MKEGRIFAWMEGTGVVADSTFIINCLGYKDATRREKIETEWSRERG